ncbi:sulfatase [Portibacter lacus]|uniref:Sulfatase n=2 Tax=Portibacter lacus TaxID=1099794 RepID=A0AA37STJ3_9BACT|nr:sulfatase [Portibacter lacus]
MNQKHGVTTPNIDKLAKSGMVFTNAYASCPVCSPTRASILTGKSPASLKMTCHIPGMGMEKYLKQRNKGKKLMEAEFIDHLPLSEVTFAEVLKDNGYRTAFLGKWHLAGEGSAYTTDGVVNPELHPDGQGFDLNIGGCAYGQPADYFSPYRNATITDGPDEEYLTDRLGEEACQFLEANQEDAFLLYLSFYTVHTPLQAPKETIDKYDGNKYLAMLDKMDQNVGKVMNKIEELGLSENTLIVFYSDNGGLQNNPPLRNKKGSLYEGGIRVPLIYSLPGVVPSGTTCDVPFTSIDIFPTFMKALRIPKSNYKDITLEGENMWSIISKQKSMKDRAIYWHFPHHRNNEKCMASAIREGDWKLIWEFETDELSLFNLKNDIGEETNLANQETDKAQALLGKLKKWLIQTNAEMPLLNPDY